MRFTIASLVVAFAVTTTGLKFEPPEFQDICVDITKRLTLRWSHVDNDPRNISFVLWNFTETGQGSSVNESIPIGEPTPLVVPTVLDQATLPAVSPELAARFSENKNGKKYQINAIPAGGGDIQDQWGFFTVAKPGEGC